MSGIRIRDAAASDVSVLLQMMRDLAEHDGLSDALIATEATLLRDGFGERPRFHAVIAEVEGEVAGYVTYTEPYAAWRGTTRVAIDDVFVRAQFRGRGVGTAMMMRLRDIGRERGAMIKWEMEADNHQAKAFYEKLGAVTRPKRLAYWKVTG